MLYATRVMKVEGDEYLLSIILPRDAATVLNVKGKKLPASMFDKQIDMTQQLEYMYDDIIHEVLSNGTRNNTNR